MEKKATAPSMVAARREPGQLTHYSIGWHVDGSINVHIVPWLGARKPNSVTPMVTERFLDEVESDGVGRGNQANTFRVLRAILRDTYAEGVQELECVRGTVVIPSLGYVTEALAVADEDLELERGTLGHVSGFRRVTGEDSFAPPLGGGRCGASRSAADTDRG
ncbi:hypothetical protein [Streptomyces sp. NPDC098101]|uniref:hypothetical protein n=1 Tax=Streptomyces sp. NPDC098101 TaxID=3366096 RepID=UPI00380656F8